MTEKELRARYKHTMFGFLWLVANPLLQTVIIGFVYPLFVKKFITRIKKLFQSNGTVIIASQQHDLMM